MAKEGSWGSRILIIAFGCAIVALGASELQHTVIKDYANKKSRPAALSDLHGSNVMERAQLRPAAIPSGSGPGDSLNRSDRSELESLIDTVTK